MVRRAAPRHHADRPLVPRPVRRAGGLAPPAIERRSARDTSRRVRWRRRSTRGSATRSIARAVGRARSGGAARARGRLPARGLQADRHVRGGVRVVHAVPLQHVRDECEAAPTARPKVVILGQRPEPDRPGHRVRLLLLPRRLRAARGGRGDGDGELQPRDRVDRLRHGGPPVLRAADARGRARHHRTASGRRAATSRASCSSAARRRSSSRCRCTGRRPAHRDVRRLDRPGRGPEALLGVASGSSASPSRPAAPPRRATRRGRSRPRSASRWSSGRRTCSAAAAWRSCTTRPRSTAT